MSRTFAEGQMVVLLSDLHEPVVARGAVGWIEFARPATDYYEVEFDHDPGPHDTGRLYAMRALHLRLATEEEIASDFALLDDSTPLSMPADEYDTAGHRLAGCETGSTYPAEYFLDESNRLFP